MSDIVERADDNGPGTPLGRLGGIAKYAIEHGLCTGTEAKPAELFLIDEIKRLRAALLGVAADLDGNPGFDTQRKMAKNIREFMRQAPLR